MMPNVSWTLRSPAPRVRIIACFGYALLLLSSHLTVWGGLRISARTGFDILSLLTWWSTPLLAAIGIVLLTLGACTFLRQSKTNGLGVRTKRAGRIIAWVACVLIFTGYGLVVAAPPASPLSVCVGALLLGFGTGMLHMGWASYFSLLSHHKVTVLVLLSLVVCAIPLAVLPFLPSLIPDFVFVGATLGTTILLSLAPPAPIAADTPDALPASDALSRSQGYSAENRFEWRYPRSAKDLIRDVFKAARTPLFCAAAIAFASAITRLMTLYTQPRSSDAIAVAGALFMALGAAVLLFALSKKSGERSSALTIPTLFRILFPVVATLLLVLSLGEVQLGAPASSAVFSVYMIMSVLMVPACMSIAEKNGLRTASVYGLFAGIVYAVFAAATLFGVRLFAGNGGFGAAASLVAILLVFYVLAMAYALVQRRVAGADTPSAPTPIASETESALKDDILPSAETTATSDPIEQRCLVVVERYGLSQRETDVLMGLAHGRTVMHLADSLCLSPNTIRSHCKTLYTKLGIHSRQELIDLVDAADARSNR